MEHGATPRTGPIDNAAHLRQSLSLLELQLRREILLVRAERGAAGRYDEFSGLVISEEEIDRYLSSACGVAPAVVPGEAELGALIAGQTQALARAVEQARAAGHVLRLEHLRQAFQLSAAEYGAFVACLAPDLDLRFERYFAYLQNDVTKKRACVQLLGKLFPDAAEPLAVRRLLAMEGSLVGMRLLEAVRGTELGLAARELRVTEGILGFLLESDQPDPELRGVGRWCSARALPEAGGYYDQHRQVCARLVSFGEREGRLPYAFLRAPTGCGKEDLILAVADTLSAGVFECGADELLALSGDFAEWLRCLERDLRLRGAFLWIRRADALLAGTDVGRDRLRALGAFLCQRPGLNLLLTGERAPGELGSLLGVMLLEIELPAPGASERLELWRAALGAALAEARPELSGSLAAKFKFGPGQMQAALGRLRWEASGEVAPAELEEALHRACRTECSPGLDALAQKLRGRYRWEDLVLPQEVLGQLREVRNAVRWRAQVHGRWGFEHKFSLGRGLAVLFSGPSGTGKTMSAEVLAGDLGLDLFKIDLSQVVSKYIGETEKNLARLFREADSANGILLFDEADALFGKRSEVKDSHDRYANIEINYLLQKLEEFEGIVILTTNMLKNLDPAFTRRIQYTVEFPAPDERQRQELWSKVFPAATPRADDLDLEFIARRFKLSGANIKNVALNSAFLAAANGGVVDMAHVITALHREYRKMGKLASRSEFGAYYHLVRDDAGLAGDGHASNGQASNGQASNGQASDGHASNGSEG